MADTQALSKGENLNPDSMSTEDLEALKSLEKENRDQTAKEYLSWAASTFGPFQSWANLRTLLHLIAPKNNERWFDAGAGVGRLALPVAPKVDSLVCVDHSSVSLKLLKDEAIRHGLSNIETRIADLCSLTEEPGTFDGVYCIEVLQHIPSHEARVSVMRQFHEILKPSGKCIVNVISWNRRCDEDKEGFWGEGESPIYRYRFTPQELEELFLQAGFRNVKLKGIILLPRRLTFKLPAKLAFLETWCSLLPFSKYLGTTLVASANK